MSKKQRKRTAKSTGWKLPAKTREKQGKAKRGIPQSESHRRRILEARKKNGKPWFSETTKKRLSKAGTGKGNSNWKGGISFEPYTVDWTETLKRAIRERDHYICQLYGIYGNCVHHIDYDKKNCDPKNLITLSRKANSKVNFNRKYWKNYFMTLTRLKGLNYNKRI